ncbi:hypothetical protein BU15DRAFT_58331 [Melanogaster broomeanus]|nr:hypothetical protein BU15DRAFT_58331 [Melanogaster broomeanus]
MSFVDNFSVRQRRAQAVEPLSTSSLSVNPPYIPAGPEDAPPTLTSQVVAPALTSQSQSSSGGLSTASTTIAVLLSLFGLAVLGINCSCFRSIRGLEATEVAKQDKTVVSRTIIHGEDSDTRYRGYGHCAPNHSRRSSTRRALDPTNPLHQRPRSTAKFTEKICSPPGSQACTVPISISIPIPLTKPQNPLLDPHPQSAPAHTLSFCGQAIVATGEGVEVGAAVSPGYPSRGCCERDANQVTCKTWSSVKRFQDVDVIVRGWQSKLHQTVVWNSYQRWRVPFEQRFVVRLRCASTGRRE